MFGFIRLIIGILFFGIVVLMIRIKKVTKKHRKYIISAVISIILVALSSFFPFENLFITFSSAEMVYKYVNFGESDVQLVIEGKNSDFVIGAKNDSDLYLIVPKTNNGWKIGVGTNTKMIVQKNIDGIVIHIYQYKDMNDYFITVLDTNGGTSQITDSYNSKFYSLEKVNKSLGKTFATYYANISNLDSKYCVKVNNNEILILN